MKVNYQPKRRKHEKLGNLLRDARDKRKVEEIAEQLSVTKGFVYQVEQGIRKPKNSNIDRWASVYGVNSRELWQCLHLIPMNLVASLKEEPQPTLDDFISQLTDDEKSELLPFINFVKWKIAHHTSYSRS